MKHFRRTEMLVSWAPDRRTNISEETMRANDRLHTATMNVSYFRTALFAIALSAAGLVASSRTAKAQAPVDNGPTDPGVRCAAKVGPGQYEFYLPGEKATDVNGNKWVCGPDGQWFRDYSALTLGGYTRYSTVTSSYIVVSTSTRLAYAIQ
jgi:hypothetical protein